MANLSRAAAVSCVLAGTVISNAVLTGAGQLPSRVMFPAGPTRLWVEAAVGGASRRLADPRCQEVLSDFVDAKGRTLTAVLTTLGQSPDRYLGDVWFVDGGNQPRCADRGVDAITVVGGRVVFLCPRLFRMQAGSKHHQILIIHEMLHTLGLGENPPTPEQITDQVTKRCRDG